MKRISQRLQPHKKDQKRFLSCLRIKNPASLYPQKTYHNLPHTFAYDIVDHICNTILVTVQQTIQILQEQNKYTRYLDQSYNIEMMIGNMISPMIEYDKQHIISEQQLQQTKIDRLCIIQRKIQRKTIQKKSQSLCISPIETPRNGLFKQTNKFIVNSNRIKTSGIHSSHTNTMLHTSQLVALPFTDSQKDIRLNHIHAFYRQKFIKEEQMAKEQLKHNKKEIVKQFKKTNGINNQQFAFDYNGDKIPFSSGIILKENSHKLLKTICKVPKDKHQLKHVPNIEEYRRSSKLGQLANSMNKIQSMTNIRDLKNLIKKQVTWTGKLQSLKNMPQQQV